MTITPLRTKADHKAALKRIEALFDAEAGTPRGDELEVLTALVEHYEARVFPLRDPDPIEAIRFCMEQQGLQQKDLVPYVGSASKVSEVLSRKRHLSVAMIRNLSRGLGIPADVLVGG